MKILIAKTPQKLGAKAAKDAADYLNEVIKEKGNARIVLSTGASQLDTIEALLQSDIDWSKVEMFHLDEYVDLPISHKASFRKYLQERFVSKIPLKAAHFVDGTQENIDLLTAEITKSDVDLGLIGIGENSHIAFNDPPANFDTKESYIFVNLDDACKNQQVGEGWFPSIDDVPKQAVTMTCYRIMQCRKIISCVPYGVKAEAVYQTLNKSLTNTVPATILKEHEDWTLYLDRDSAAKIAKF